ncbi:MAG: DEAD/DEAH box helicase, partial [Verrucomicrobia bacterium]|nr:DEAD/DEAH box helicase [Verrucomicrobiota bacterium]
MTDFASFGLDPNILKAIGSLGFETPTPVQAKVIPLLLESSQDLVALAQTGTGKTAAFGLPLIHQVDTDSKAIQALILCPTRELCLQICRDLKQFTKHMPAVRTVAVYGGAPIYNQLKALENGVHIVVGTPGRMHDILRRGKADFSKCRWTVLDEADEMLSMGFEEDLKAILSHVPGTSQTLLFSATMPRQIAAITGNYMEDAKEITIGTRNVGAENVQHECYRVHARDRYLSLKRIVDFYPDMYGLIFCRTRIETQEIAAKLIKDGYSADALHGDLSQQQRDRVMGTFRDRSIQMLVATDVAARGLDINDLTHVINYQLPDDLESYTHRSGRTGRAGKAGISVVLIHMREQTKIRIIEQRLGKRFEHKKVPSGRQVCEAQLYHLISRAKDVTVDDSQIDPYLPEINRMLEGLSTEDLVKRFVSLEFNRFLSYYKDAPDLNVQERPARERIAGKLASLFMNVGRVDNFSPKDLMGMLNRGTRGGSVQVGRISVQQKCTFFDVTEGDRDTVMEALNGATFGRREVRVEPVSGGNRGAQRPAGGRPGRPQNRGGQHGRRPPQQRSAQRTRPESEKPQRTPPPANRRPQPTKE